MRSTIWHEVTSTYRSLSGLRVETTNDPTELDFRSKSNIRFLLLQPYEIAEVDDDRRLIRGIVSETRNSQQTFGFEEGDEIVLVDRAIGGCGCGGPAKAPPAPDALDLIAGADERFSL